MDPMRIVTDGYEAIADRYAAWELERPSPVRRWFLAEVLQRLSPGARVLELGCGSGVPVGRAVSEQHRYVGVDIASAQLALARKHLPEVPLIRADLCAMLWRPASFDAIVAFYVFNRVPPSKFEPTVARIASWLRPGGFFGASLPVGDSSFEDVEPDWFGVPMYFSGIATEEQDRAFALSGLAIDVAEVRDEDEDGEMVRFHWVIARKR